MRIIRYLQDVNIVPIITTMVIFYKIIIKSIREINKNNKELVPFIDTLIEIPKKIAKGQCDYYKIKKESYKEKISFDKEKEKYKEYKKNKWKNKRNKIKSSIYKITNWIKKKIDKIKNIQKDNRK